MENSWKMLQSFHTELPNSSPIDTKTPLTGMENDAQTKSTMKKEILEKQISSSEQSLTCIQQQQS